MNDYRAGTVRDVMTVTVKDTVKPKRKAPRKGPRNGQVVTEVTVDPALLDAAWAACREGERPVIVSATRVDIVRY